MQKHWKNSKFVVLFYDDAKNDEYLKNKLEKNVSLKKLEKNLNKILFYFFKYLSSSLNTQPQYFCI